MKFMIIIILLMMKNNSTINSVVEAISGFIVFCVNVLLFWILITYQVLFFTLNALFNVSVYFLSFFFKIDKDYTGSDFLDQVEDFIFPFFVAYYRFFFNYLRVILYFLAFIVTYFSVLQIELSNESLLLGCIIFTIFLLYNSARDFMLSSITNDVQTIRALTERKLDLLSRVYSLEKNIIEQQSLTISVLEDCVSKLSIFEINSLEIDSTIFENLLNQTFSDSIFDYYMLELKDDFYKDYFFIEENFEESSNRFIEENFLLI
jgi:hypothetical protein